MSLAAPWLFQTDFDGLNRLAGNGSNPKPDNVSSDFQTNEGIDAALSPLKAHIVANIRQFIGSQDPLAGQNLPLAFRTAIVARTLDDRWHAELHFRGPTKCFYEAVQTTGSVKTKSGFRQNPLSKLRSLGVRLWTVFVDAV